MIDRLDVRWAARVMRAAVQHAFAQSENTSLLNRRSDAIFRLLDAPELAGFRATTHAAFDSDWRQFTSSKLDRAKSDPAGTKEAAWMMLGQFLEADHGVDVLGRMVTGPPFASELFYAFRRTAATMPELWHDTHHAAIEACIVAINPTLQFRTAPADLLPEDARIATPPSAEAFTFDSPMFISKLNGPGGGIDHGHQ